MKFKAFHRLLNHSSSENQIESFRAGDDGGNFQRVHPPAFGTISANGKSGESTLENSMLLLNKAGIASRGKNYFTGLQQQQAAKNVEALNLLKIKFPASDNLMASNQPANDSKDEQAYYTARETLLFVTTALEKLPNVPSGNINGDENEEAVQNELDSTAFGVGVKKSTINMKANLGLMEESEKIKKKFEELKKKEKQ
uniref:Uncharacterized protein n=1 Tax=Panagrolaimus sp. ES5 TaxID=591445 RepID=A0AC34FQA2_9BILA